MRASARTPAARLQPHAHYIMPMPVRVSRLQRATHPAHVCEYMNAEAPLSKAHGSKAHGSKGQGRRHEERRREEGRPLCRMDGDHLRGRWMQTCDPRLIQRPDHFAYKRALPKAKGWCG